MAWINCALGKLYVSALSLSIIGALSVTATPSFAQESTLSPVRRAQNHWDRCLEESYRIARKNNEDKNLAAEVAFQACASEENELRDVSGPVASELGFSHLKAETKRLLIEKGKLPHF
jgi:hypothetical protein